VNPRRRQLLPALAFVDWRAQPGWTSKEIFCSAESLQYLLKQIEDKVPDLDAFRARMEEASRRKDGLL
jgi:hypothetical protein